MATITQLFTDIIKLQKEIGYNMADYLLPGLSREELNNYEEELGFKFNDEIIELYSITGGIDGIGISMGDTALLPLEVLANFEYVKTYHSYQVQYDFLNYEDHIEFGNNVFILVYDGGSGKSWIDLNEGPNYGKMIEEFGAGELPIYTFNSISSYLQFVKNCYEKKLVFLDEHQSLEWDLDIFYPYKQEYLKNQS